jgi:hypothetical protein
MGMSDRDEIVAVYLYGRGEYMMHDPGRKTETVTVTTKCWICGGALLDDGTSVWANVYFGLHKTCASASVTSEEEPARCDGCGELLEEHDDVLCEGLSGGNDDS